MAEGTVKHKLDLLLAKLRELESTIKNVKEK